jgi:hypothetical protein
MSSISTIVDQLNTTISGVLTTYSKVPNAYEIGNNAELFLIKGYAIGIDSASNTNRQLGCQLSIARDLTVILVNQVTSNNTDFDAMQNVVKSLMEDQYTIIKAIEKDSSLNSSAVSIKYASDAGIEFGASSTSKYFLLESIFTCEYFEDLNS